jgi:hypothetical protein
VISRRRDIGQWLVFAAICLLALAIAYGLVAQTMGSASGCACTEAEPAAAGTSGG